MIERANYEKVQIFLACLLALNDLGLSKTTSRICFVRCVKYVI